MSPPAGRLTPVFLLAACAGAPTPVATPPADHPRLTLEDRVRPFPVTDSAGRSLDLPFLGGFNSPRPQLVDFDADGLRDLVVQEYGDQLMLLGNEGAGRDGVPRFALRSRALAGLRPGEWSRLVDVDGDGALDLFGELPFGYMRVWRRLGRGEAAPFAQPSDSLRDMTGAAVYSDRQNIPQFVDFDCDGRLDLFIGTMRGTILRYVMEQDAGWPPMFRLLTDRFADLEIITGQGSMHGANTMAFADVDQDGDLDLLWGDFFEAGLLWFENVGTCAAPSLRRTPVRFPPTDPLITSGYNAPAFGDVNGDGHPDLVVGVLGGAYDPNRTTIENLWQFSRDASGGWTRKTGTLISQIDVGSESVPALLDVDGDADLDLLLANKIEPTDRTTARIYRFENVGTPTAPSFVQRGALGLRGGYSYAPAAGDLDGDGRGDLLVGSFGQRVEFWRNLGPDSGGAPRFELADTAIVSIPRGSHASPALGDLDGDGDLDLLLGRASGYVSLFRNDGTPRTPRFNPVSDEWAAIRPGRRSAPHLADLDGDGDLDLLVGSDESRLALYWNEGTRTDARLVLDESFQPPLPPLSAPRTADLDGDGRPEVIVGNSGGGVLYFHITRR
ncbi:MAG TPA: VCBS repeat-containing protein [Gemmatimonadales bacterium]|nr:VCBS repeat-containing protein [Gemmatimonadales bacterium]